MRSTRHAFGRTTLPKAFPGDAEHTHLGSHMGRGSYMNVLPAYKIPRGRDVAHRIHHILLANGGMQCRHLATSTTPLSYQGTQDSKNLRDCDTLAPGMVRR